MFSWFRTRKSRQAKAHAAYLKIVEAARAPRLFTLWHVADTVDGRFDSVTLHAFLVLRRLRAEGEEGEAFGQVLFDLMFKDFDQALREMGVGDMSVGKRVKKMAEAFLGRVSAYEEALEKGSQEDLKDAIERNLYRNAEVGSEVLDSVTDYVRNADEALREASYEEVLSGRFEFEPVSEAAGKQ